jgi:hypothetical protein
MASSELTDEFAAFEWERQVAAVAEIRQARDVNVPATSIWPALSRLAAVHVVLMQSPDDDMMEQTLLAMSMQTNGLPVFAFVVEAYHAQAAEMLERWRAQSPCKGCAL